jgi:hypothetical protein
MTLAPPPPRAPLAVRPAIIRPRRPSALRYWLAALIVVAGLVGSITWAAFAVMGYQDHIDSFARTAVPGQVAISVADPGGRTLYYEGAGRPTLSALHIAVTDPRGNAVAVHRYSGTLRYESTDGTSARAVGTFRAAIRGTYVVSSSSTIAPGGELAIGDSFVLKFAMQAVLIIGVFVATFGAALALSIVTFIQRRRI